MINLFYISDKVLRLSLLLAEAVDAWRRLTLMPVPTEIAHPGCWSNLYILALPPTFHSFFPFFPIQVQG